MYFQIRLYKGLRSKEFSALLMLLMKQCSKSDTNSLKGQLLAKQMVS